MHETIEKILGMEKYMPVMSPEELRAFEHIATGKKQAIFDPGTVEQWEQRLRERENGLSGRFKAANIKSNELCNQKKAKK